MDIVQILLIHRGDRGAIGQTLKGFNVLRILFREAMGHIQHSRDESLLLLGLEGPFGIALDPSVLRLAAIAEREAFPILYIPGLGYRNVVEELTCVSSERL